MENAAQPYDPIHRPKHYVTAAGIEAIDVIEWYGLGESFHLGNCAKYALRAGKKGSLKEDRGKCEWYLRRFKHCLSEGAEFPSAYDHATSWASPSDIIEAFEISGTSLGRVVERLLAICLSDDADECGALLDAAIAEVSHAGTD